MSCLLLFFVGIWQAECSLAAFNSIIKFVAADIDNNEYASQ